MKSAIVIVEYDGLCPKETRLDWIILGSMSHHLICEVKYDDIQDLENDVGEDLVESEVISEANDPGFYRIMKFSENAIQRKGFQLNKFAKHIVCELCWCKPNTENFLGPFVILGDNLYQLISQIKQLRNDYHRMHSK
jgi:hypothetical protein